MKLNWSDTSRDDLRAILAYVGANFGRRRAEDNNIMGQFAFSKMFILVSISKNIE